MNDQYLPWFPSEKMKTIDKSIYKCHYKITHRFSSMDKIFIETDFEDI